MRHTKSRKKKTRRWLGRLKPHARCDWSPARLEGVKGAHQPASLSLPPPFPRRLSASVPLPSVFPSCWASSAHYKAGENCPLIFV